MGKGTELVQAMCVCTYVYDTSEVLGFRPWLRRGGTRSTSSLPGTSASLDPRDRQMG